MNSSRSKARFIIGGILIGLGAVLLLSNANVINLDWAIDFVLTWWPMLLIVWGLWELVSGGFRFRLWPIILLLLGIGLQLSFLNLWEWDFKVVWPVFIVIIGLSILLGRQRRRSRLENTEGHEFRPGIVSEGRRANPVGSGISWRAVFNNVEDRFVGPGFPGGDIETNFGNVVLDLRQAELLEGSARLDVNLTFGGLHLSVPASWRVTYDQVETHFGHVQDNRAQPEPAEPQSDTPEAEIVTGELIISGAVTFGNLEISN